MKIALPNDFPTLTHQRAASAYWRSKNRADIIGRMADVIDEFRAHHQEKETKSAAWDKTWQTWYVRSLRFIPKPRGSEPRKFIPDAEDLFNPKPKSIIILAPGPYKEPPPLSAPDPAKLALIARTRQRNADLWRTCHQSAHGESPNE